MTEPVDRLRSYEGNLEAAAHAKDRQVRRRATGAADERTRAAFTAATLSRYADLISRRTPLRVLLRFQLALPSEMPGYLLDLVRYRFVKYVLGDRGCRMQ